MSPSPDRPDVKITLVTGRSSLPDRQINTVSWVVTFDETWRTNTHRTALPMARRCHPDGFVEVVTAEDMGRDAVLSHLDWIFGGEWLTVRPKVTNDNFRAEWPLGCLGALDLTTPGRPRWLGPM